jgi:hypothetical protein
LWSFPSRFPIKSLHQFLTSNLNYTIKNHYENGCITSVIWVRKYIIIFRCKCRYAYTATEVCPSEHVREFSHNARKGKENYISNTKWRIKIVKLLLMWLSYFSFPLLCIQIFSAGLFKHTHFMFRDLAPHKSVKIKGEVTVLHVTSPLARFYTEFIKVFCLLRLRVNGNAHRGACPPILK